MTSPTAKIGSVWSVPQLGDEVRCLVLSDQRQVVRAHPEYRVMPLERKTPKTLFPDQFSILAEQTSGRERYAGQLYNIRSIPASALGRPLDLVLNAEVIDQVRDAYRKYLSSNGVDLPWLSRFHRRREIDRWQRMTGELDSALVGRPGSLWVAHAELTALLRDLLQNNWGEIGQDEGDDLLPLEHLVSWGGQAATIQLRVLLTEHHYRSHHMQPMPRSVSMVGHEQAGELEDFRSGFFHEHPSGMALAV